MMRIMLWASALALVAGCGRRITYEIDFSQAQEFEWDERLRVTKATTFRVGPFLTLEEDWKVDKIELMGPHGRVARVDPKGYSGVPVAALGIDAPMNMQILGTRAIFRSYGAAVVLDQKSAQQLTEGDGRAESGTSEQPQKTPLRLRTAPVDMKPYAENAEELTPADWWAIALQESEQVALDFTVPHEGLRILMQGDPRKYGPAVIEIRTQDGRLVKRFEEVQISVHELKPEASGPARASDTGQRTDEYRP